MQLTKPFYRSMTFWGSVTTIIPMILASMGLSVTPEEVAVFDKFIELTIALAGVITTIIGRARARTAITLKKEPKV